MKKVQLIRYLSLLLFLLALTTTSPTQQTTAQPLTPESQAATDLIYLYAGQGDTITRVPAPIPHRAPTATINVTYIGGWPAPAQTAFQHAANIWSTLIASPVPIHVEAEWAGLPSNVLGGAGPALFWRNQSGLPANVWYPSALANRLHGSDLAPSEPDILTTINSDFPSWYFGLDGNTPFNQYDFVSVVLHELGHGLGFTGSMRVSSGVGSWGFYGSINPPYTPTVYDRFIVNGAGQNLVTAFPNISGQLAAQLTSNNLFFNGPNAIAANGGARPKMYAPASWQQGSSFSHLDENTYPAGTPNSLMTPALANGESNHNPGPIALAIFQDIGWTSLNTAPVMNYLPGLLLQVNTIHNNAIDLWAYTTDNESADNQLTFAIIGTPNPSAGVSLDSNRYIDIYPNPGWTGQTTVTIRVTDPGGLTAEAPFNVTVTSQLYHHFLPITP